MGELVSVHVYAYLYTCDLPTACVWNEGLAKLITILTVLVTALIFNGLTCPYVWPPHVQWSCVVFARYRHKLSQ